MEADPTVADEPEDERPQPDPITVATVEDEPKDERPVAVTSEIRQAMDTFWAAAVEGTEIARVVDSIEHLLRNIVARVGGVHAATALGNWSWVQAGFVTNHGGTSAWEGMTTALLDLGHEYDEVVVDWVDRLTLWVADLCLAVHKEGSATRSVLEGLEAQELVPKRLPKAAWATARRAEG